MSAQTSGSADGATPAGVDADRVARWLAARTTVDEPLTFDVITGGRSNLTYHVADASGRRWVLRRPPLHSVLQSAHDVAREHRVMAALRDTAVPVPPVIGYEADKEVTGAPFYMMEFVDGLVPRDSAAVTSRLDGGARRAVALNLADTLRELHDVDVDAVGLRSLARRPTGYIQRQLRRWSQQYEHGSARDLPLVRELHDRLAAEIPPEGTPAIVHGDYRLDNTIVGEDGTIRAVLDWELCTIGDPLADLGLLYVYWVPPRGREIPTLPAAGAIPGMPPIEDVIAQYARHSTCDLSHLDFYVAFGYWKLAIILEGVYTRFSAGAYGDSDGTHAAFAEVVVDLLDVGWERITGAHSQG